MDTFHVTNRKFRRMFLHILSILVILAMAFPTTNAGYAASAVPDQFSLPGTALDSLIEAAQNEGSLTVIALPNDWCNFGEVISGFTALYGIPINSASPSASSEDELQAIRDGILNPNADTPDVIDVGPGFAVQAKSEGLIAPYQVSNWDTIPEFMKDGEGYWYGDYYGVMSIAANTSEYSSPTSWGDLLAGETTGPVALGGDPTSSNLGFFTVYAAALANGGSLDEIQPGVEFFRDLNSAGRLLSDIGNGGTLASGETPVLPEWSYLALQQRDDNPNASIEVVVPSNSVASFYAQAINAYAPHPNAARLWMEYLYSDEVQLTWLNGYCYPARFEDLLSRGAIPDDLLARLPDITGAVFPSLEQIAAAKDFVNANWACMVYGSNCLWRDEFDGSLAEGWNWIHENPDKWNLTEHPGFLRIYTSPGSAGAENLLLRPIAPGDFMIKTHLLFEPGTNFQLAGLVLWQDADNFLQLGRAFCDVEGACVGNGIYFDKILGGNFTDSNFAKAIDNPSDVYLRLERRGNIVRAFYSVGEGISWYEIGIHGIPDDFQVNAVGLTASQNTADSDPPADFDFFELTEGSGFLPEGFHDYDQGDVPNRACNAGGWAADPDNRAAGLNVDVVVDDQTVASLVTGEFRQDLLDAGVCEGGNCGFSTSLWNVISSYEQHRVDTWAQDNSTGEWVLLNNSAKTLTCRTYDIYAFDSSTGTIKQVTNMPDKHEYNPRWSPDGTKIVHDAWSTDFSSHAVYITDVKSSVSTPLAGAESGSYPTWAPNDKWIAFDRGADNDYRIFVVPPTGGVQKLVREDAFMATWAPDSKRLAFHQQSDGSIRTITLKTGKETFVVPNGNAPAWSPDGDWIAFERDGDIWKVNVDKVGNPIADPIQLTNSPLFEARPTWSNNNKTIAFHAGMGDDADIWTVPAAGGMETWLNGAPNYGDYDANYSFNGRYISYSSFSPDGQAARMWIADFLYDAGTWSEGEHSYYFENTYSLPQPGSHTSAPIKFNVAANANMYNGYVLLRTFALRARVGNGCPAVDPLIDPKQNTRFSYGWLTDFPMTYAEATAHFDSMTVKSHWDDGMSTDLQRQPIYPSSSVDYNEIVCSSTEAPPEPVLYIHYEYPDVVEGDYELGHTVQVTVFDSDGNTKATATVETMEMPHWGGAPGFRVEQWDGMEGPPDIQPGDGVRAVVDGGPLTVETRIGEITARIDPNTNSLTGTINAPWAGARVNVLCMPWGAPEGTSEKETTVTPDGISEFTCTWDSSEWDIQPGETAGVAYWAENLHWIANAAYNPWINAFPDSNQVFGYGWPIGSEVNLNINGQDIATATVKGSPWDANDVMAYFDFGGTHDLAAGDIVTLSGSGMERTHIVQNLAVTDVNMETNTVSGTADPGATLHAWVHGFGHDVQIEVIEGMWNAYFGADDFHLEPGMCGRAEIRVEGNNSTNVDWCTPNPHFGVRANVDQVEAWEWNAGETVTLTIDNPGTPDSPDFSDTRVIEVASWDPNQTYASFNLWDVYDIQPGDVASLSNGTLTKTTTVTNLAFTNINVDDDVVTGVAVPNSHVDTWACENNTCINRHVDADGEGVWTADFGNPGAQGDEQNTFNIVPGTWIDSSENDEDGDQTFWGERVPNPYIEAAPYSDWIHAREWPIGTEMTLEIDDPSNGPGIDYSATATMQQAPWNPGDPNDILADFRWPDEFAPGPGYVLTMSGNGQTKMLTTSDLHMTGFDLESDTVSGKGTPDAQIQVCANIPNRCITRWVTADGSGNWTANYGVPGTGNDDPDLFDVQPGSNGWAADYEADSDRTWFDWWVPNPRIVASITEDWFYVNDFAPNTELTFAVYESEGGSLISEGTTPPTDGSGFAWIDSQGWDLAPGNYLVVNGGSATKDLVIEDFTFDVFDMTTGHLDGTAPGPAGRRVWAGIGWQDGGWSTDVFTDAEGKWAADYGNPVPTDYWWVAAQIFDDDGDASELRPNRIINLWVAAYTYDLPAGYWSEGQHSYHFEAAWNGGNETTNEFSVNVSNEAPSYDGYVLLRQIAQRLTRFAPISRPASSWVT